MSNVQRARIDSELFKTISGWLVVAAFVVWAMFGIFQCSKNQRDVSLFVPRALHERALDIPLKMVHLEKAGALTQGKLKGSMGGSMFGFGGSIDGSTTTEHNTMFYWVDVDGSIVPTSLPYSKLRFKIDDSIIQPTITFKFWGSILNGKYGLEGQKDPEYTFADREESIIARFVAENRNANRLIMSEGLIEAVVSISRADMESQVYLIPVSR
jgi:hypothetical protein